MVVWAKHRPLRRAVAYVGTSEFVFDNLSQRFRHLRYVIYGPNTTATAALGHVLFQFNGDTGNNYYQQEISGAGAVVVGVENDAVAAAIVGWGGTAADSADVVGYTEGTIFNYTSTSYVKVCQGGLYAPAPSIPFSSSIRVDAIWASLDPITSIRVFPEDGLFAPDTVCELWGEP